MSEPLSWQFILALQSQLQGVLISNGYHTDLGADVRLEPWAIDELAGEVTGRMYLFTASIQRDANKSGPRTKKDRINVLIDVIVPTGQGNSHLNAHRAIADIRRALAETDVRAWAPDGVLSPEIDSQQIDPRPEGLKFVRVQVVVSAMTAETFPRI